MLLKLSIIPLLLSLSLSAQWLDYKTPGLPRLPDGKPNLSAPAPRTSEGKPDLSGLWRDDTAGAAEMGKAMDAIKPLPWAAALNEKRRENLSSDSPFTMCLPEGPNVFVGPGKVVQTPGLLLMLHSGTAYREIHLDGRGLEKDPNPSWMGYSVGHWEGDTLVVESNGFNDRTWLDDGYPHTEALRVTERLTRPDFGHLRIVRTFADPGALKEPWTVPLRFELDADTNSLEYVCNENEKDRSHLIGKASDDKGVAVSTDILARYAGSYEVKIPKTGQIMTLDIRVDGDHLVLGGMGPSEALKAVSNTEFTSLGGNIKFLSNGTKPATTMLFEAVEGELKAVRK